MVDVEYLGKIYTIEVGDISNRCRDFYEKRFNHKFNPITDCYANEWLERFLRGYPDRYMDSHSLEVYLNLIKEGF
jgi:hypothetical protein